MKPGRLLVVVTAAVICVVAVLLHFRAKDGSERNVVDRGQVATHPRQPPAHQPSTARDAPSKTPGAPTGQLRGVILDRETGAGIGKAEVRLLSSSSSVVATAGPDGGFAIPGSGLPDAALHVHAPGYVAAERRGVRAGQFLTIHLLRNGRLYASVTDDLGVPLGGARVIAHHYSPSDLDANPAAQVAGEDGVAVFPELGPGEYVVFAYPPLGRQLARARVRTVVRPDDTTRCSMRCDAGSKLEGRVVDSVSRVPIVGARISYSLGGGRRDVVVSSADGRFEISAVPRGRGCVAIIRARGFAPQHCVLGPTDGLPNEVSLCRGSDALVKVTDNNGATPLAPVHVRVFDRLVDRHPIFEGETNQDGMVRIVCLSSDPKHRYFVVVETDDGRKGAETELRLSSLSRGRIVEMTLVHASCSVEIRIVDTAVREGRRITLARVEGREHLIRFPEGQRMATFAPLEAVCGHSVTSRDTGPDGRVHFARLRPGSYACQVQGFTKGLWVFDLSARNTSLKLSLGNERLVTDSGGK